MHTLANLVIRQVCGSCVILRPPPKDLLVMFGYDFAG
jgi:hypothetical protein